MKIGVILLNFGEPEQPNERDVVPFLERIFATNALLEGDVSREQARARSAELARRRAPSLIEMYERIGGSPLNAQARAQATALQTELVRRGHDAVVQAAMQFTEPSIAVVVQRVRWEGVRRLVGLPVYPLCGESTTVAALASLERTVADEEWDIGLTQVSGWHTHPFYTELRAAGIRRLVARNDLDLADGATLVFSAHGTPVRYLLEGSRYDLYVRDSCSRIAEAAGIARYVIGYQNHTNRPVEWTQPEIGDVVRTLDAESIVVLPVSFMHEQSETLAELDIDLREVAESAGMRFFRVPIPHDDPRFAQVLGDVVEGALQDELSSCRCRVGAGCLAANV
ncbi:MAG: ferrochelatase [Longimicrobiales bacterium]